MGRRINGLENEIVPIALIAGAGYLAYKLLSPIIGLLPDNGEKEQVQNQPLTQPDLNPFSYTYRYSLYAQNPNNYGSAWWNNLRSRWAADPQGTMAVSGVYNYCYWGETLITAFGTFFETDSDVDDVFNSVQSKADVSNIACYLFFTQQVNLYSLLHNGAGFIPGVSRGLTDGHLAQIINIVNSLPDSN